MTTIRLRNSLTGKVEELRPLDPKNVRMYVCGPTVYDRAHIGNARPAVVFDTLFRLLRHVYGPDHVTYIRNVTDVDDKINAKSAETGRPIGDITEETLRWYHEDMGALGMLEPTHEPRATGYIGRAEDPATKPTMIGMIKKLIETGHAYAKEGHVLFRVRSFDGYGRLSGRSVDDMIAGARVEVAPYKEDPMDFVLWKPSEEGLPGWDSPWGRGRPGWHIECSAMSEALLGRTFDIHGGGIDLLFPHHENEIAQSVCAHGGAAVASIWMHNEMLQVEGKKMSKSLGNFFTVRDLLNRFDRDFAIPNVGPAIRLRFLQTHYRAPIDIGPSHIEAAAAKLDEWLFVLANYQGDLHAGTEPAALLAGSDPLSALCDDLNTSAVVTWIDQAVRQLGRPFGGPTINEEADDRVFLAKQVFAVLALLGIDLIEAQNLRHSVWSRRLKERAAAGVSTMIEALLAERSEARRTKDFARADALRDGFAAAGVLVKDMPAGTEWELTPNFDRSKLEALK